MEIGSDGLGDWVEARIERATGATMTAAAAYDDYIITCDRQGIKPEDRLKEGAFTRRLAKRYLSEKADLGPSEARVSGYQGLRLRPRGAGPVGDADVDTDDV